MRLNVRLIECFHAIMTVGTVTAAADMLNTSQPAVSRSIQQLEAALGLKLFDRDKGRLLPTSQAFSLFEEVKKTFLGLEHIARVASNLKSYQSGSISIVCSPAFSNGFISEVATRFIETHKNVSLTVETHLAPTIAELMSAQRFDLGLAAYSLFPAATDTEVFAEPDEVCILPPNHPMTKSRVITPQCLAGSRFIFLGGSDPYRFRLDKVFETAGVERDLVIETRNTATVCAMVLRGAGVAIVNRFTAVDYLDAGLTMRRFSASLPFTSTLLRAKLRPTSPLVDLFIRELYRVRDHYLALSGTALDRQPHIESE
ncbi:transcriptional regulator [Rhizobium leguminosarum bv. trifolii WSM597]|uniref:Transcriptional regulator n=1 Tax=Rhizobium leguminosarum bv. trifolii WSM597 TaxID=754764 RepID=I9XD91_RHILT|nr:LysR family transcriptional regulator [Rhizobium leguminosarum]EJB07041.1 transcriptional regulator [Rhizobium leguminosarum bv. trifolii WSM597]